jgi:hypothetical protein
VSCQSQRSSPTPEFYAASASVLDMPSIRLFGST